VAQYIICHEPSDKYHEYDHTHIAIEFKKRIDIINSRHFDYKGLHPSFKATRNWIKSVVHCIKKKPAPVYKANFDVITFLKKK